MINQKGNNMKSFNINKAKVELESLGQKISNLIQKK